jgi:signal transduction histidine kinase
MAFQRSNILHRLEFKPTAFNLVIQDDGKKFSLAHIENSSEWLGLIGIQQRSRLIGGILKIQLEHAKDVTISVQVNN